MFLEIHDTEVGNTLIGSAHRLDYKYQAEMWVADTAVDHPEAMRWMLFTDDGRPVTEWQRRESDVVEVTVAANTRPDSRALATAARKANEDTNCHASAR